MESKKINVIRHILFAYILINIIMFLPGYAFEPAGRIPAGERERLLGHVPSAKASSCMADSCEILENHNEPYIYWRIPDIYIPEDLDFINMCFCIKQTCLLTRAYLMFYDGYEEFSDTSGQGIEIIIFDSRGNYIPDNEIIRIPVLPENINYNPVWTEVDLSSYNLFFSDSDDFHIGWTVVDQTKDNISILSDSGSTSTTFFGTYFHHSHSTWYHPGNNENFLIEAEVCYPNPLEIVSTTPTMNQLNVADSSNISAVFCRDINPATVIDSSFKVHASSTGLHPGSISYNSQSRTITFDPFADFAAGEKVSVIMTNEIKSPIGMPLESYIWSFTTAAVENGSDTFLTQVTYPVGLGPVSIYGADFNGDGHIDLATANSASPSSISILINNGDGTFYADSAYSCGNHPQSIFAADYDSDGDVDIAGAYLGPEVPYSFIKLNNGDGTFGPSDRYMLFIDDYPSSIYGAELNGDGHIDLATACGSNLGGVIIIQFNRGDGGTFTSGWGWDSHYGSLGPLPRSIIAADFDGDADNDLAWTNDRVDSNVIIICMNNGSGTFGDSRSIDNLAPYPPTSIISNDFNGDGANDLAVVCDNKYSRDGCLAILLNDGNGNFNLDGIYDCYGTPVSITSADFDNDGHMDIAVVDDWSDDIMIYTNNGDGTFAYPTSFAVGNDPTDVFAADFNGDGSMDIAVCNGTSHNVSVLLNTTSTSIEDSGEEEDDLLPYQFELFQNYPNPFNPFTTIHYSIQERSHVTLDIFDVSGRRIARLVDSVQEAGRHEKKWYGWNKEGTVVSSGVYFYKLRAGKKRITKKMILLK